MPKNNGNGKINVDTKEMRSIEEIDTRHLPYGQRRSPYYELTDDDIKSLKDDIALIGADESVFVFDYDAYAGTVYIANRDIISVKGNVFPDTGSIHPRDLMSARAVLAHEYYGHKPYRYTKLKPGSWNDEFRASYMAAKNTPNLTDEDKRYLVLDAIERAKQAGIKIKNNEFMQKVLYGYGE